MGAMLKENHYHIIEDLLPEEVFKEIELACLSKNGFFGLTIPMYFSEGVAFSGGQDYFFTHNFYDNTLVQSDFYYKLMPSISERFELKTILRGKVNWYPNLSRKDCPCSQKVIEHEPHVDYSYEVDNILIFVNDNDGFTRMADGTKIKSKRNSAVLFRGDQLHNSSTCTTASLRCTININCFFQNVDEFYK